MYLFRLSTRQSSVWSTKKPKPVYVVASDKDKALSIGVKMITSELVVTRVSKLATQNSNILFVGL